MNQVTLIGRLTKDPDVRYTQDGMCVARFSVAINRFNKEKGVDYPNVIVFGKTAENCEKYLSKGSQVGISGRIQTGSYEKDGRKVYTTDVVANSVEFLSRKEKDDNYDMPDNFSALDEDIPY